MKDDTKLKLKLCSCVQNLCLGYQLTIELGEALLLTLYYQQEISKSVQG